ncbi:MAG: AAA family ATPase [Candidatus Sericytochromatia bacterium]
MKTLALGIQTFRDLINNGSVYVDKTKEIYNLVDSEDKRFFFLSRPRRFGKSLLISTLEEIFLGNKELFKDLWIYNKIQWKKYPVITISMNSLRYNKKIFDFENSLLFQLNKIFDNYNLKLDSLNPKDAFEELIKKLSEQSEYGKVVVLIDEYDKPITEFIEEVEISKNYRESIKNFYETIKANDKYIRFCMLTGVSKFSKTSFFSSLNNLNDITLDSEHSQIVGINEEQLYSYFDKHIIKLGKKYNQNEEDIKQGLKTWYNGYSWDGENFLYNPYSLISAFTKNEIKNYWFSTGTPTFLIDLIKKNKVNFIEIENIVLSENNFDSYDVDNMNIYALLFQTGYLTIKNIKYIRNYQKEYTLSYPNMEVKESLFNLVLKQESKEEQIDKSIIIGNLVEALERDNITEFISIMKTIFADIPYDIFIKNQESYYHTILYLVVSLLGIRTEAEMEVNTGRIDCVIQTETSIFVFEFKIGSAKKAMEQIKNKKYYAKFLNKGKKIFLVGVGFSIKKRNIYSVLIENK